MDVSQYVYSNGAVGRDAFPSRKIKDIDDTNDFKEQGIEISKFRYVEKTADGAIITSFTIDELIYEALNT